MKALCWHGTGDVRIDTVPVFSLCDTSNPNAEMARKRWGTRQRAYSRTPTCLEASLADRRKMSAYRLLTWVR